MEEGDVEQCDFVGIDVGAKELVVAIRRDGNVLALSRFENNSRGHRELCRLLTKGKRHARVCLESTGIYSLDVALALHRTAEIEVMVANPGAVKDFGDALLKRTKTDPQDALVILEFVERMPFVSWQPPTEAALELRAIARRIAVLTQQATAEKNRLHAAEATDELGEVVRHDIELNLRHLRRRLRELLRKAVDRVRRDLDLSRKFDRLVSVKGIARASAIAILGELAVLPPEMSARQWVAHAGLDPKHFESGTSVAKRTRISKIGNGRLRTVLFMPALVAARHEPHVRAFHQKLVARGKKPIQATVAVMRKLLHSIHGMFERDAEFDGNKFYVIAA